MLGKFTVGMESGGPLGISPLSLPLRPLGTVYSSVQCSLKCTVQCTVHCTVWSSLQYRYVGYRDTPWALSSHTRKTKLALVFFYILLKHINMMQVKLTLYKFDTTNMQI